ncbi:hypothetical protein BD626DRAFT_572398 [Schizophyllum amplum]|uniref:Uncharacterized protein n=1 Tax=Schizophyllum amplum TaxID=97359 RepID=A0A550C4I7_9AGAR|nr:hypothetical protein BD626DRAFT_572398 [Auriculariopsis ampla]
MSAMYDAGGSIHCTPNGNLVYQEGTYKLVISERALFRLACLFRMGLQNVPEDDGSCWCNQVKSEEGPGLIVLFALVVYKIVKAALVVIGFALLAAWLGNLLDMRWEESPPPYLGALKLLYRAPRA